MNIVLVEPEIPPNAGNVARLCAATKTTLHLIEPFGFKLDDTQLKRAGMDYWRQVEWHRWKNWSVFELAHRADATAAKFWFIESKGPKRYTEVRFSPEDYLVFGRETAGLPKALLEQNRERWLRIPMFNDQSRSLNLSNCAALVLFEALRQQGFKGEI
jgi:tRNA (cytidine/uridine-2'-O-)-methyltransferase